MSSSTTDIVHPVPVDEVPGWTRTMSSTFLADPNGEDAARWVELLQRDWEPERAWGARDRGRWVGTLRTEARNLTIPGPGAATGDLTVDAVTNVTVAATHRRRGLMSRMLGGSLEAARERGDPLSILIAAEWPIYGRFGYAPAIMAADYELRRSRRGAACDGDLRRIRQVERDEFGAVAAAVYASARRERVGQVDRSPSWWNRYLGRDGYPPSSSLPHNWLVHEGEDGPDGLLSWTATGGLGLTPPLGTVKVTDLVAADDVAYRDLWAYLCGLDVVDTVVLRSRPVDEPARWLLRDGRTLVMTEQVDYVWLRLLDVPAALAARRYATAGELVMEVIDEQVGGYAAGRYRLSADGDRVQCHPTDAPPDIEIDQSVLASVYLGGVRLRERLLAGGVTQHTAGALERMDVMFGVPLAPWNATGF